MGFEDGVGDRHTIDDLRPEAVIDQNRNSLFASPGNAIGDGYRREDHYQKEEEYWKEEFLSHFARGVSFIRIVKKVSMVYQ